MGGIFVDLFPSLFTEFPPSPAPAITPTDKERWFAVSSEFVILCGIFLSTCKDVWVDEGCIRVVYWARIFYFGVVFSVAFFVCRCVEGCAIIPSFILSISTICQNDRSLFYGFVFFATL